MDFESVIRGRRSIRAYTSESVPEDLVREILGEARWAPSWRNTQAWNVWVVSGGALERYKAEFKAASERDDPAGLDLPATAPDDWPAACSLRTAELMKTRAAGLAAAGESTDPAAAMARMADLFGAPCLLVFGFDDCLAEAYASYDTGAFVDNVCLSAFDKGLGTCVIATVIRYPELLRRMLPGTETKRFVVAVTLGHPQEGAPANTFERSRATVDEFAIWVS